MVHLLWTDSTLVAAGGSVASGFVRVAEHDKVRVGRSQAGGTYAFEVDWSRDGAAVDLVEMVATTEDAVVETPIATEWARFRVRNTDGVNAFTAHRTVVSGASR